jgi:hypothetical protein
MAAPPTATVASQAMDPTDVVEYTFTITQGSTGREMLAPGEGVSSYTLTRMVDAIAAGLVINTDEGRTISLVDRELTFWPIIEEDMQDSPIFEGVGVPLFMVVSIVTDSSPPRHRKKTIGIQVAKQ